MPTAISATFSAKDIDSQSADRDKDLRSADWFETDKFPTMTFVSKSITGTPQAFTVVGDLTMHGVTKPVTLAAKTIGKMTDARSRTHVGYTATANLDRRDWGLNWGTHDAGRLTGRRQRREHRHQRGSRLEVESSARSTPAEDLPGCAGSEYGS